jgi:4-hydroxy-tetrahydrodipicolinate synthase
MSAPARLPFEKSSIRARLRGSVVVPMVTPVRADLTPDAVAAGRVADYILAGGCQGLMAGGTNGEGPSLPARHRIAHVAAVAAHVGARGFVFAGIGAASFADAVEIGRASLAAGAAAVVAHPAPYFSPNSAELEAYYCRLIDAIGGPFFLYNIPVTTRVSIPLEVVERLSRHPLVLGIKDSEGDATRQEQLARTHAGRADFTVFCGATALTLRSLRAGADGNVPSVGNFAPAACRTLVDAALADRPDAGAAQERADELGGIYQKGRALPQQIAALKACVAALGLCARHVLPPLVDCSDTECAALAQELEAHGIVARQT